MFVLCLGSLVSCSNPSQEVFLKDFYENYVFNNKDYTEILKGNSTKELLQLLEDEYEEECMDGECYAIWLFRTNAMDCHPEAIDTSMVEEIVRLENDWYRIKYLDMGWKGSTRIHFVKEKGKMLMAEIVDEMKDLQKDFVKKEKTSANNNDTSTNEEIHSSDIGDNGIKKSLTIFKEPAYLMSEEEIEKELVGLYYWTIDEVGFGITKDRLTMVNGLVKEMFPDLCTSNINGTVPIKAKYEKGNWYKQENSKNNMTMYYLVGHKVNVEVLVYENGVCIGNRIINTKENPNGYVMVYTDKKGNWAYKGANGEVNVEKNKRLF